MKSLRLLLVASFVLFSQGAWADSANPPGMRIEIPNTRGLSSLQGYLTQPVGKTQYPAVLILLGSGPGSTDNPKRDYNPIARLAEELARNGFASLRFDKRGTGYNTETGSYESQGFEDYIADAEDAFRVLSRQPRVRRNGVYLFGHSMGTLVAARLAAQGSAAGMILSAGPSGEMLTVMEEQQVALLSMRYAGDIPGFEKAIKSFLLPYQQIRDNEFTSCPEERCTKKDGEVFIDGQSIRFWSELLSQNMRELLARVPVRVPRLCLAGASDWIVDPRHASINCRNAYVVPEMDHFFSVQPSREASIRFFLDPDFSQLKMNFRFTESLIRWLKTVEAANRASNKPVQIVGPDFRWPFKPKA